MVWSWWLRLDFPVPNKLKEFMKSLKSLASESYSTVNTPTICCS